MGKGFNNYMCKKFFHPASRDNLKRVWMAEQQAEAYKKKQEELRTQYEKEQNLHDNKALLSKESKDKLSVNFMYELPAGLRREHEQQHELSAEQDVKFEWQRKFNAPRESYCKDDTEIRDQPFGIQVRNVRCIKCHKWGHINTDKECGMYSVSMSEARKMHAANGAIDVANPAALHEEMRNDGLRMKNSAMELQQISQNNQRHAFVDSDGEPEDAGQALAHEADMGETSFIKTLTREQKMDLLRKMELIERKQKELRRAERRALKEKKKKKKEKKLDEKSKTATKKKKKRDSKSKDKKERRGKEAASRSPSPVRKHPQEDAAERKDSRRERQVDERRGRRSPSREPRSRREDRPTNGKRQETSRRSRSRGKCRDKSPTEKHPERKRDASSASSSSSCSSSSASDANSSHSSPERPQPTQKDKIPDKRGDKRSDSPAKGRRSRSRSPGHRKRLASPPRKSRRSRSGSRKQDRSGTPARKQERSGTPARRSATPARKPRRSRSRSPTQRKRRTRSRSPVQRTRRSRSRSPARKPRRSRSGSADRKSRRSRSQSRERRHRQR